MSESLIKISKGRILRTVTVIFLALLVWILGTSANLQSIGEAAIQDSQDASTVYKRVYNGWKWWHVYCARCHGEHALGSPLAPNLREPLLPYEEFLRVARDGAPEKGMPAWNQLLDDEQITDVYIYVRARSKKVLPPGRPDEVGPNGGAWIPPADWPETQTGGAPEKAQTDAVASPQPTASEAASSSRVYVSNEGSGNVTVIDAGTDSVLTTIPVGSRPREIQVSPDGKTVYVALSGSSLSPASAHQGNLRPTGRKAGGIGLIDTLSNELVKVISGGSNPEQFVVSRDGTKLYVANEDASLVSVVDVASGKMVQAIAVGKEPEGVALSPDGKIVYVTNETSQTVSVIDTETNKVTATFVVGGGPRAVAFMPNGSRAYVTSETLWTLSVVDTENHRVTHRVKLEGDKVRPMGVAVAPDGKRVYVTTGDGDRVFVIDTSTHEVIASFEIGKRPWGIAITPDGRKLYIANGPSDDVSVVEVETLQVVARIKVGERPWGVAIVP